MLEHIEDKVRGSETMVHGIFAAWEQKNLGKLREVFLIGQMLETFSDGHPLKGEECRRYHKIEAYHAFKYNLQDFAKALLLMIQSILNEVIHVTQTSFIGEISIFDSVFLFWESMAATQPSHENLEIILLGFEKYLD